MGLRIISACFKKAGHKTKIIFVPKTFCEEGKFFTDFKKSYVSQKQNKKYPEKTIYNLIALSKDSDLIGISLSTNFFEEAVQITKRLKKELKTPIIWGGIHPTVKPKECLKYADMICIGEGEEAMVELAEKMEKGEDYSKVRNIGLKDKKGNITLNPLRPLIQDLDSLPFQDYDLESQYLVLGEKIYHSEEIVSKGIVDFFYDGKMYRTLFTRGCPFSCAYCCNSFLNRLYFGQKIFRKRSVDNVIEELKIVKNHLSYFDHIWFADDHFLGLSLAEIKEFSEKYKENIKLPFGISGAHPINITQEKLQYLVEAGLKGLRMGIQSGSEKTKKIYNRHCPNSQVEKAAKIINKFKEKIKIIHYDIIVDNPFETEEDICQTLMFLTRLPVPYELLIFSLTFYPGTELYTLAEKTGIIKYKLEEAYYKSCYNFNRNYFNRLFFLLHRYAILGKRIPPLIMFLLTNKMFRKIKLSWILYQLLKLRIFGVITLFKNIKKSTQQKIVGYFKDNLHISELD